MAERSPATAPIPAQLSLWDTVSIIVGIIVGVGIFSAPAEVFRSVRGPWQVMGFWALGGILSLIGALCWAELASTYPRSGGEYVYLTRAYGSGFGFLFAWAQLAVIRTAGGIAAPAYIFGSEAARLWPLSGLEAYLPTLYAVVALLALTIINILGANPGKHTQNLLTVAKVLGIGLVVVAGFSAPLPVLPAEPVRERTSFALAMILVLYTYDGWNEATYVCGEVRDWRRNMPRALILGTLSVTLIYLVYNAACIVGLGFEGARNSAAPHRDVAELLLGRFGGSAMMVLVMISALGCANGTIFTAARLYAAMGVDHRVFAPLGWWSARWQSPAIALGIQVALCIAMVLGVALVWKPESGFAMLVDCSAPVFWFFFLMTGLALFILRWRDPGIERPFRVPFYPVLPLIFCGWSGYMLYGSIKYTHEQALVGLIILLAGLPLYFVSRLLERPGNWSCKPDPLPAPREEPLVTS